MQFTKRGKTEEKKHIVEEILVEKFFNLMKIATPQTQKAQITNHKHKKQNNIKSHPNQTA